MNGVRGVSVRIYANDHPVGGVKEGRLLFDVKPAENKWRQGMGEMFYAMDNFLRIICAIISTNCYPTSFLLRRAGGRGRVAAIRKGGVAAMEGRGGGGWSAKSVILSSMKSFDTIFIHPLHSLQKSSKRINYPMAYFWVQLPAVVSYLLLSVLYM
ncbi:hypothetical protein L1987_27738 [Smallanthus sonchifolius]|uniref:Uncharacterized protein n=1 Tax=Smallanthus sonchifolius TaxID=185202 RepID=A0ACB9IBN3_9ASTR|nr:hypothetical protein L1987_27738 [Smallanthus sonchifolius]